MQSYHEGYQGERGEDEHRKHQEQAQALHSTSSTMKQYVFQTHACCPLFSYSRTSMYRSCLQELVCVGVVWLTRSKIMATFLMISISIIKLKLCISVNMEACSNGALA